MVREGVGIDDAYKMYVKYRRQKLKSELYNSIEVEQDQMEAENSDVSLVFTLSDEKAAKPL